MRVRACACACAYACAYACVACVRVRGCVRGCGCLWVVGCIRLQENRMQRMRIKTEISTRPAASILSISSLPIPHLPTPTSAALTPPCTLPSSVPPIPCVIFPPSLPPLTEPPSDFPILPPLLWISCFLQHSFLRLCSCSFPPFLVLLSASPSSLASFAIIPSQPFPPLPTPLSISQTSPCESAQLPDSF